MKTKLLQDKDFCKKCGTKLSPSRMCPHCYTEENIY